MVDFEEGAYRVLPEYLHLWTDEEVDEIILTYSELSIIAHGLGIELSDLLDQVEEV